MAFRLISSEIPHALQWLGLSTSLSSFTILATGCAVAIAIHLILTFYITTKRDPLSNIPGPFWARYTRLWIFLATLRGDFHSTLCKLHRLHGPVVRIAPGSFSFDSLEAQRAIYRTQRELLKTRYYNAAEDPDFPNVFSMIDRESHAERRNGIASLYSMSCVKQFEKVVQNANDICCRILSRHAETEEVIDFPVFLQRYAFDVIGEITSGHGFGMMESASDTQGLMQMTREITLLQGLLGLVDEWYPLVIRLLAVFGIGQAGAALDSLVESSIALQQESASSESYSTPDPEPFVSRLLRMETANKIHRSHTIDSIGSNLAAGADTTAITIAAALYYIYRTPLVLQTLRREIDKSINAGVDSKEATFDNARRWPYLQAVIQETLRLHPAVGHLLPRNAPEQGIELDGYIFPKGTSVGVSAWALHRNKAIYGEDAECFRPERFLRIKGQQTPSSSFSFGAGSRTCLGKNISLLQINLIIPLIVCDFDLDFDGQPPWTLFSTWFVWPSYQCVVRHRRHSGEA